MRPPHGPDTVRGRGARRRGFETLFAEGGGDGVAWALRTPGEEIESFIFGRVLDRITKEPIIEQGKRKDKKLPKKHIAERVQTLCRRNASTAGMLQSAQANIMSMGGMPRRRPTHFPHANTEARAGYKEEIAASSREREAMKERAGHELAHRSPMDRSPTHRSALARAENEMRV